MAEVILVHTASSDTSGEQLTDELLFAIDQSDADGLIIDIGRLTSCGTSELGALILAGMRAAERRVPMTLTNVGREAMHVLLLSGLAPLYLGIVDAEAAA